ncbi:MAG: histidinol dehydrogenase [Gemmatimonadales bacterium]|nr:histidinol dehydrogenase [Gemmatimonadales bacterium]
MIIPSIDIRGGETVQLVGGRDLAIAAGSPDPWLERFAVAGEIAIVDLDGAFSTGDQRDVIARLCERARCRVGGGIRDFERARFWLDAGAARIVLGTAAEPELLARLPRDRTIAAVDAIDGEVVVDGWRRRTGRSVVERLRELRPHVGGFLVTFVEREGRLGGIDADAVVPLVEAAGDARLTIAGGVTTADDVALLDRMGADAQVGMALYTGRLLLGDAIGAPLRSDRPDGLFPTVVTDERGVALGLAYSSHASLRRAVEERRGIYHSRRRGIWVKGESSGATQALLRVDLDCDRDTLRFVVRQHGAGFCHRDTATCWGHSTGVAALESTLRRRREIPEPGSYTQRLWDDPDLLASKLSEEAAELADAGDAAHVVREAADVTYFTGVALQRAGVGFADVDRELDRRALHIARRPGDAKPDVVDQPSIASPFTGLRRVGPGNLPPRIANAVDPVTATRAAAIVDAVRAGGDTALLGFARELDGWTGGGSLLFGAEALVAASDGVDPSVRALLERVAGRIHEFAMAQRGTIAGLDTAIPGGRAGHAVVPVSRAGCYAPAGRFPLPSSLLMGVVTARAAGVAEVWVATPAPSALMLATAAIAGATGVIAAGGAHAIAALAYGTESIEACDVIVGPGSKWVTAAKRCIAGDVAIDFLAGPSELVVVADGSASVDAVAADLLAQAEHDADALPILVATTRSLLDAVDASLVRQLAELPASSPAHESLRAGFAVLCLDEEEIIATIDAIAPEHLQLSVAVPSAIADRCTHAGAMFIGHRSAEVFGDYGAGPNHVLPTGRAARHTGGLSVMHFLRLRTWLEIDRPELLALDTAMLARLEGLEAHARAAEVRRPG